MYTDESGATACLVREYGRAERGEKVPGVKAGGKYQRTNVIAALCGGKHTAVRCCTGRTNAAFFEEWFGGCLLKTVPRAGTVIMDNASFHRKGALEEIIRKARRKVKILFLPPCSPDYNPIEKSWANMKRRLRDTLPNFPSVDAAVYDYFYVSNT